MKWGMSLMALGGLIMASGCSYEPDEAGLCRLNCSKAIISGNDSVMSIKLKTDTVGAECAAAAAGTTIGPFIAHFLVGEAFDDGTGNPAVRPVPNISIEPILSGFRPNIQNENDNDDRYRGILTPRANWCSDSCGVVQLQVASICPPAGNQNDLNIQVHSGALYSDPANFPITTIEVE